MTTEHIKPHLEKAVFGYGLINPMLAIPQLYQVWGLQHVSGLSAITVGSALLMSALWTAYGLVGKQTVVWSTSILWVFMNGATLLGVAIFR